VIGANTSYAYTMAEMRQRVKRLKDAGMGFIMIQGAPFLFQIAMTEFLKGVREDLASRARLIFLHRTRRLPGAIGDA